MTDIERLIKLEDGVISQKSKFFMGKSSEFIKPYKAKAYAIKADLTEQRDTMIERLKNAKGESVGQVLEEMKKTMYDWKKALKDARIRTSVAQVHLAIMIKILYVIKIAAVLVLDKSLAMG